jgi:L-serine dehydratase
MPWSLMSAQRVVSAGFRQIAFDPKRDIIFDRTSPTPGHPNTLEFRAVDSDGSDIASERWCSIGGGFVVPRCIALVPFPFASAKELLAIGERNKMTIGQIVLAMNVRCGRKRKSSS